MSHSYNRILSGQDPVLENIKLMSAKVDKGCSYV